MGRVLEKAQQDAGGPQASFGRQLAGKGPPQHCLTSPLFESIVRKSATMGDWALGKGTEKPGELTEVFWDLFDFLDVVVELCLRTHSCSYWEN